MSETPCDERREERAMILPSECTRGSRPSGHVRISLTADPGPSHSGLALPLELVLKLFGQ